MDGLQLTAVLWLMTCELNTAGGGLPQAGAAPGYQNRGEGLLQAII